MILAVKVTPRASRTQIVGIQPQADGRVALAVRVTSPPVDGAANDVLIVFLAKTLGVTKSAVMLRSGSTGRLKIFRIEGDGVALGEKLGFLA